MGGRLLARMAAARFGGSRQPERLQVRSASGIPANERLLAGLGKYGPAISTGLLPPHGDFVDLLPNPYNQPGIYSAIDCNRKIEKNGYDLNYA
ncbi:hypothetical protein ACWAUC_12325 [Bradyrhizobium guangdongense]